MTESSLPWSGTVTGDAGPYTAEQWADVWNVLFTQNNNDNKGILQSVLNELEITGAVSPISVNMGCALVDGTFYQNTASVSIAIPTPSVATRIDRIVLRKSWASQTIRIVRLIGNEGGAEPTLTQTENLTWEVPLAKVTVTTLGAITITDERRLFSIQQDFLPPEGFAQNYRLSITVASNNLTVAIKTTDGNDPSVTNSIKVRIGNTERRITSPLSVTINSAINTFNAGSLELQNQIIDYAVYLGWRASNSSVFIMPARIYHGRLYSDFSATATNERYGAFSGAAPAATDEVELIGRFAATLSGGAGYTWTVPVFTLIDLINFPIYESRWLTWSPQQTGFSSVPTNTVYKYKVYGTTFDGLMIIQFNQNTDGISNGVDFTATLPFTSFNTINIQWQAPCTVVDNGVNLTTPGKARVGPASNLIIFDTNYAAGAWTASGGKRAHMMSNFLIRI